MLTSVHIKSFRGISGLKIDALAPINIFVGANGSGKTSALKAIGMVTTPGLSRGKSIFFTPYNA